MVTEAMLTAEVVSTAAKYIIVVEKDSVFQSLCTQRLWDVSIEEFSAILSLTSPSILLFNCCLSSFAVLSDVLFLLLLCWRL